jgi:hypothetical protein
MLHVRELARYDRTASVVQHQSGRISRHIERKVDEFVLPLPAQVLF